MSAEVNLRFCRDTQFETLFESPSETRTLKEERKQIPIRPVVVVKLCYISREEGTVLCFFPFSKYCMAGFHIHGALNWNSTIRRDKEGRFAGAEKASNSKLLAANEAKVSICFSFSLMWNYCICSSLLHSVCAEFFLNPFLLL